MPQRRPKRDSGVRSSRRLARLSLCRSRDRCCTDAAPELGPARYGRATTADSELLDRHVVVFDVGETLVDETRAWSEAADAVGVTALTLFGAFGALIERRADHRGSGTCSEFSVHL
jgi:hypothetical protein